MSVVQNFAASETLSGLQGLIDQTEPAVGPLDGLSIATQAGAGVTALTFDTALTLQVAVSTLVPTGTAAPANRIAFIRGKCLIGGQPQDLTAYVALDEGLLAARCVSFLQAFGWTRAQAIGITASIRYESGFNPAATGDSGSAYGLCQWRGARQTDFAQLQDRPILDSTFHEQLEFIVWELSHTEHVAGALLRATTTIDDAAQSVCVNYERPKNPAADSLVRVAYAGQLDTALA